MDNAVLLVLTAGAVTFLIRFAPFLFFAKRTIPDTVRYLGNVLPPAIMGTLILLSIRQVDLFSGTHGIPEAAGILATVLLHLWRRQTLLSIAGGTAVYMLVVGIL